MSAQLQHLPAYLQRLDFERAPPPDLDTLRELQRRHTAVFAFETIATLLQAPVPVDLPSLQRKLLHEGRGGYCYELNRMFLALLQDLGFQARGLTGRVVMGGPEDAITARTHLVVLVTIDGVEYLADVGFGGMVPTAPLALHERGEQATAHEPYRLDTRGDSYVLRARSREEWQALYVFDAQLQSEIDYVVGNWYVSTHPQSPFRGQLFVARTGPGLRKTLNGGSFAVHRVGAASERIELPDAAAVMAVLRDEFELRLPDDPQLPAAIERRLQVQAAERAAARSAA
ncbi:arylamine N-acetyltransferase family protein [Lysobacter gummosus]|uniref:arylamine N-acetyltransferase family protein n=1 Tax=Lysobacter gummosus TaxID=262324 RepID=UPI0036387663